MMFHFGERDSHIPLADVEKIRAAFPHGHLPPVPGRPRLQLHRPRRLRRRERAPRLRAHASNSSATTSDESHCTARNTMTISLKDPTLLRQQCYVDGAWIDADAGGTVDVTNPATGEVIGTVPNARRRRDAPRHRGRGRGLPGLGRQDGQGAHGDPAALARPDARERRRPRRADDRRAGQAARRGEGRDRLRRRVHRVVRRGRQARLRRRHPGPPAPTSASSCCASRSASSRPSRRGTSRRR